MLFLTFGHRAPSTPKLTALDALVRELSSSGRYSEATPLAEESLALSRSQMGENHVATAARMNRLAELYRFQSRYAESERLHKSCLVILEEALGPEHPDVGVSLNNLSLLYSDQGRYIEAEPLYRRSHAVREKSLAPDHPDIGQSLNNLANLYVSLGRFAEAEPLFERSRVVFEKALGPEHPWLAASVNNLGFLYRREGRFDEAEQLIKRSLAIREKVLGSEHPDVATSLLNLAMVFRAQGRHAEAELLTKRSLSIREKMLGREHPTVHASLNSLAWLALDQNNLSGAADHWLQATALLQRRAERGLGGASEGTARGETQRSSWYFEGLVKTMYRLSATGPEEPARRAAEMFETAQWGQGSEAAAALAQMAARSAKDSPELAALVRERQDLVAEWQGKDKLLIAARSESPARRNAAGEKALSERLAAIDQRLASIDARLARDFPDYAALANPKLIRVAEVQAVLSANEALVLFLETDVRFKPLPEETFVWVVTKTDVRWVRSELGTVALRREVAALRCGLDAAAWWDANSQCPELTGASYTDANHNAGKPPPFDAARAHSLYKGLFAEVEEVIRGKHLLVVLSGALTTLPLQVLVTEPPKSKDFADVHWLNRDHAITVLPSVASLAALRRTGKPSAAHKPMIGFGNPLLDGDQDHPQHGAYFKQQAHLASTRIGCAVTVQQRTAARRALIRSIVPIPQSAGVADLAHLKRQTPLPETADEVCAVARSVKADPADMRIGDSAREGEIKRLSGTGELSRYRILHFATHGVLAGQISGTREPGLILSPPATATAEDDGYLSGSEIASLKLDADWVILSACNTASGAGEGNAAEALSGLARAFFYAGARALLVSHWEVDSDAAVKLVTGSIGELTASGQIGRSEALRRAMLAVMADTTRPSNWVPAWHPSVWAPFVVVGEGGAGR